MCIYIYIYKKRDHMCIYIYIRNMTVMVFRPSLARWQVTRVASTGDYHYYDNNNNNETTCLNDQLM